MMYLIMFLFGMLASIIIADFKKQKCEHDLYCGLIIVLCDILIMFV